MRCVLRACLLVVLVLAGLGVARAQDIIRYHDRAARKEVRLTGKIQQESAAGIKVEVKEGGKVVTRSIAAGDLVEVLYHAPEVGALTFRRPFGKADRAVKETNPKTRGKLLQEALDDFLNLETQLRGNANARRYIQFKIAMVTAQQAQDDATKVDQAIKLLADFKREHPATWQSLPALKTLARLQEEAGRSDEARKTYEEIAELPDVPLAVQQESEVLVSRLLLRGGKYADAEKRLRKLSTALPRDDGLRPYVQAYLVESRMGRNDLAGVDRDLGQVLAASTEPRLRGVVHNLLGDYHRRKGELEEAFWHYLRVDVQYNEDPEEQARALYHLVSLYDRVKKDPVRGKECARRLQDKRFSGTTYQKLVKPER